TNIQFVKTKWFSFLWWGYSISLLIGLYISFQHPIPLMYRSIILVAFFMTAVSKFIFAAVLIIDDLRRGGIWVSRLFGGKKHERVEERFEELEDPLPEVPKNGITRS